MTAYTPSEASSATLSLCPMAVVSFMYKSLPCMLCKVTAPMKKKVLQAMWAATVPMALIIMLTILLSRLPILSLYVKHAVHK